MTPVKVKLNDQKSLLIVWDDGVETDIPLKRLRDECPCATCIAQRENTKSHNFINLTLQNQMEVMNIEQVGTYAIQITWKDGHNTGIYEYPYLRQLAENSN